MPSVKIWGELKICLNVTKIICVFVLGLYPAAVHISSFLPLPFRYWGTNTDPSLLTENLFLGLKLWLRLLTSARCGMVTTIAVCHCDSMRFAVVKCTHLIRNLFARWPSGGGSQKLMGQEVWEDLQNLILMSSKKKKTLQTFPVINFSSPHLISPPPPPFQRCLSVSCLIAWMTHFNGFEKVLSTIGTFEKGQGCLALPQLFASAVFLKWMPLWWQPVAKASIWCDSDLICKNLQRWGINKNHQCSQFGLLIFLINFPLNVALSKSSFSQTNKKTHQGLIWVIVLEIKQNWNFWLPLHPSFHKCSFLCPTLPLSRCGSWQPALLLIHTKNVTRQKNLLHFIKSCFCTCLFCGKDGHMFSTSWHWGMPAPYKEKAWASLEILFMFACWEDFEGGRREDH